MKEPEILISFDGIAGIQPLRSVYADVEHLWGGPDRILYYPAIITPREQSSTPVMIMPLTEIAYEQKGLIICFRENYPLKPWSEVNAIKAERGADAATADGLKPGMRKKNVLAIIEQNYQIRQRVTNSIDLLCPTASGNRLVLKIVFKYGVVEYIGLFEHH